MVARMRFAPVPCVAALFFAAGAGAQPQKRPPQGPPKTANAWMKTPMALPGPDDVIPYVRHLRDEYWDNACGHFGVLTPKTVVHDSDGDGGYSATEIPELREGQALFVGTFSRYRTFLTPSGRAIYTDVAFTVEHLSRDAARGHAVTGLEVTVSMEGGTVRTADGQVISFLTDPKGFFMQPSRTYLMMPRYHPDGDFYIEGTPGWDLSDGTVKPNSYLTELRAARGDSKITGLTKDELIRVLDERFSGKR